MEARRARHCQDVMSTNAPQKQSNLPAETPGQRGLRAFSKLVVLATLALIFFGGQVKSHEAGLAVPDWPTTFGYNMFLFPMDQWVGGIFHEHFHRLWASGVGLLTVILSVWVFLVTKVRWLRVLSVVAVATVILQGILGGLTVIYQLPTAISASHATLAQTFLLMLVILAYGLSREFRERTRRPDFGTPFLFRSALVILVLVYGQLVLGSLTRHTNAGLAVPDFPTMAGRWTPSVSEDAVGWVNSWRFDQAADGAGVPLAPVDAGQMLVHLLHRGGALVVTFAAFTVLFLAVRRGLAGSARKPFMTLFHICMLILVQFTLGVLTVWTVKSPMLASLHVATGALLLALTILLVLRSCPLTVHRTAPALKEASPGAVSA